MKPLMFTFYNQADILSADGKTLDLEKYAAAEPVASIRAKPEAILRTHLKHLGFFISRMRPDLEGERLEGELHFPGDGTAPRAPVLIARHMGEGVAVRSVRLSTLDTMAFVSRILKKKPWLKNTRLLFSVNRMEETTHECI